MSRAGPILTYYAEAEGPLPAGWYVRRGSAVAGPFALRADAEHVCTPPRPTPHLLPDAPARDAAVAVARALIECERLELHGTDTSAERAALGIVLCSLVEKGGGYAKV